MYHLRHTLTRGIQLSEYGSRHGMSFAGVGIDWFLTGPEVGSDVNMPAASIVFDEPLPRVEIFVFCN